VADRLAVMRAGRVVQEGPIGEVWQRPADADTALFLGYANVLRGAAAAAVAGAAGLPAPGEVAVRRSAVRLTAEGPLAGVVESARATPERDRLVVRVDGVGVIDAVAATGSGAGPGDRVRLSVDPARLAMLPDS
jgi:thiamine transport system ATP-binding protein